MRPDAPRSLLVTRAGAALALAALMACGAKEPPLSNVGVAEPRIDREPPAEHPPDAGPAWELAAQVPSWPVLGRGYRARGHLDGRATRDLRANPVAAAAFTSLVPSGRLPDGAVLVESPSSTATSSGASAREDGARGATFAMIKHPSGYAPAAGDWEFVVIGADGVVESRGPEPLCARCHAEAMADFVFPVPTDAR